MLVRVWRGRRPASYTPRLHALWRYPAPVGPCICKPADCTYAALSLTIIRILLVSLGLLGSGLRLVSGVFLGGFRLRGLASILFVLIGLEEFGVLHSEAISRVVVLTVLLSAVAHGATAYPFARRYSLHVQGAKSAHSAEDRPALELPVRISHAPVEAWAY